MDEINWVGLGIGIGLLVAIVVFAVYDEQEQLDLNEEKTCLGFENRDLGNVPIRCIKYFDLQNIEIVE